MKILHIPTGGIYSDGINKFIYSFLSEIKNKDINFSILQTKNNADADMITLYKSISCNCLYIGERRNIVKYFINLLKLIKTQKFDIIHVHGSSAIAGIELFAGLLAGCKVRIMHSHNTTCSHRIIDKILRPFFNKVYNVAFACGKDAGQWLYRKKKFTIIHNARNINEFQFDVEKRKVWRQKLNVKDSDILLGHVGRLNNQKNQVYLLHVLNALKGDKKENYKLVFVGEGENYEFLHNEVNLLKLNDDVIFTDKLNSTGDILSAFDIMLLPSLYEGLPLVLVEWQLSNLPCIISNNVTSECIFTDRVKVLPLTNDYKQWADEIVSIDRNYNREDQGIFELASRAGYELKKEAKILCDLYIELYNKRYQK